MTKEEKFAFVEQFVMDYRHVHYRIAYSYVKNEQNALDIVQEATLKALRSIQKLDEIQYLKTWFYRILVNTALDFLRKHQRVTVMEDDTLQFLLPSQENEVTNFDLLAAIDRLSPIHRTVIVLRFLEDLKLEEIAAITDTNVNTVKTRLYAALKKLRLDIGEEYL